MTRAAMAVLAATLVWSAAEKKVYGQAAPQKKVKDQGEYDLYNNAVKETDQAKKLQYVNQWAENIRRRISKKNDCSSTTS